MDRENRDMRHPLEEEFGLSGWDILNAIKKRFRLLVAVRGAIAEEHVAGHLRAVQSQGLVDGFEEFDEDGFPDIRVDVDGKSYLMECKTGKRKTTGKKVKVTRVSVDFQRTRNPQDTPWERYYTAEEFDILAVWVPKDANHPDTFWFAPTNGLELHKDHGESYKRLASGVTIVPSDPGDVWTNDLPKLLQRLPGRTLEDIQEWRRLSNERRAKRRREQAKKRADAKKVKKEKEAMALSPPQSETGQAAESET
ncbi:MAG: hypothetical protein M3Q03_09880 [Chloroflexota bacterium]|nr:hypothetical protein [Chloroflexota bacterium]